MTKTKAYQYYIIEIASGDNGIRIHANNKVVKDPDNLRHAHSQIRVSTTRHGLYSVGENGDSIMDNCACWPGFSLFPDEERLRFLLFDKICWEN